MSRRKKVRGVYEHPTEAGVWCIQYFENGRRHREKVGAKSVAIAAYQKRKTEIREGRFFPPQRKHVVLFGELADDALEYSRQNKQTAKFDGWKMAKLRKWFGSMRPEEITPQVIERHLAELRGRGGGPASAATFNRTRALLSLTFTVAMRNGKAESNPARLVKLRSENNARVRFLRGENAEEDRLRRAIRKLHPSREPEFDLALHTGMRRGEQYGLAWQHVDFERKIITIPKAKHGEKRHLPINSVAANALFRLKARGEQRVCHRGRDGRTWFGECVAEAGIEDFRWHDLRHTFASRLVMAGVDLVTVKELMGHKSIQTTMRYAHLAPAHMMRAIEVLAKPTATPTAAEVSRGKSKNRKFAAKA